MRSQNLITTKIMLIIFVDFEIKLNILILRNKKFFVNKN